MKRFRQKIPLALLAATTLFGCLNDVDDKKCTFCPTPAIIVEKLQQNAIDKIDLLLGIDNSRSMADKQQILALAIPDLVKGLVNPRCLDGQGNPAQIQPSYPTDLCPAGTNREFKPILDIHIGVTTSSIGGHGADSCPDVDTSSEECAPSPNTTNNDHGHLLARLDQCGAQEAPTFKNKKFLAWDPSNKYGGEIVIDNGMGGGIVPTLRDMVIGTGQIGCGYESQLESIYRFLADPNPYESIVVDNYKAIPTGTDMVLLQQRAEFMRPDSLLAIVMLTDENDCSIKEFGQFYYVGQLRNGATPVHLPRARQECAKDPNDPCCKSCGQSQGVCPDDPTCKDPNGGSSPALLSDTEDHINLRCWDQKRRFGIDFLYPTDRYVTAFSNAKIPDRDGNVVDNPIFSDLNPQDDNGNIRDPGLVFFAGIVGVPWQDIARDRTDLRKGFKDPNELNKPSDPANPQSPSTWDVILGDPTKNVKPLDPLMIETFQKRSGTNPITGDPIADASLPNNNPINGHDWTISNDDLQYACIFPLLPGTERDCTNMNLTGCDCSSATNNNPLCNADPNNMNAPTLQVRAKAYPGIRPLQVLRSLGSQGIVASVCPAQLNDFGDNATDFGYRPAIGAIIDRLKTALGDQCLSRTLVPDATGNVPCVIIEARNSMGQCTCDSAKARGPIKPENEGAKKVAENDPLATKAGWDCYCEITQTQGAKRDACQNELSNPPLLNGQPVNGWCYVDATTVPATGNAEIVKSCPDYEKRIIRFVGEGEAATGATLFITCSGDTGG